MNASLQAGKRGYASVYEDVQPPTVLETNLGAPSYREPKRPRRHSPIREDDPFVPSSKDLERMDTYEDAFPTWQATPEGGQTVRVALPPCISKTND